MALDVQASTDEQIQQAQTRQAELHKSVMDSLKGDKVQDGVLKDLGISPETEPKKEPVKKSIQEEQQEEEEEEQPEESNEKETEENNSEESQEEESEEVIPKSKVQKRFDELTARLKAQEKQLEELRASKETPKDEVTKQLEGMTTEQLKAAKLEVRKAQIKEQDDSKLNELLSLEEKIDSVMQQGPVKFQQSQMNAYAAKANEIAEQGDIPNLEANAPKIKALANEIYARYPILHKDINGQATALEMAVERFKAISSVPGDRTKETELKRQNNTLKKKVTLDTKGSKVNADKSKLDTLRKNAIGGTMRQKESLVRNHPMFNVDKMIPDEYK